MSTDTFDFAAEMAKLPAHPDPRDGAGLLDIVEGFLARFVAYPSEHEQVAHTLWVAHTWAMDCWESTPRIFFTSPEPGSGKSRALEATELLVPRPVHAVNTSPAYLFRKVSDPDGSPTLLYDEIDTVFGPRAKENEDIRGMLNAGHRKGATAGRCVVRGNKVDTEELPAYCAVALAGLDDLPDTVMSRSIVVRMRRRAPTEHVEPFRRRSEVVRGESIAAALDEWVGVVHDQLDGAWPDMPAGVEDRNADVWEALLAIADAAGGDWPERARVASVALVAGSMGDREGTSLGVRLLADLRDVFAGTTDEHISTEDVLTQLADLDESPWADLRGKPLDARGLSNRLRKYGVRPKVGRVGDKTPRGYSRSDLHEPWSRYLPSVESVAPSEGPLIHSSKRQNGTNRTPEDEEAASPLGSLRDAQHPQQAQPELDYVGGDGYCKRLGHRLDSDEHRTECRGAA